MIETITYILTYVIVSVTIIAILMISVYLIRRDMAREMKKIDILVEKVISLKYR